MLRSLTGSLDYNTSYHGSSLSYVPQHDVSLPQHEAMSTPRHIDQLVPKHAMQLTNTSVPVVGTVSRRIDREQTELEQDSIPRSATYSYHLHCN